MTSFTYRTFQISIRMDGSGFRAHWQFNGYHACTQWGRTKAEVAQIARDRIDAWFSEEADLFEARLMATE